MAKIKTLTVELLGATHDFKINVGVKGVFSTDFPPSCCQVTKCQREFGSLADLEAEIHRVVREVNEAKTETADFIYYWSNMEHRNNRSHSEYHTEHIGLEFSFIALRRITRGDMVQHQLIRSDVFNDTKQHIYPGYMLLQNSYSGRLISSSCNKIPFTPEAMQFFESMQQAIAKIGTQLENFIKPETLAPLLLENANLALPFSSDNFNPPS